MHSSGSRKILNTCGLFSLQNVLQAGLEELLLHEGNFRMDWIHVFKHFLALELEISIQY